MLNCSSSLLEIFVFSFVLDLRFSLNVYIGALIGC